MKIQYKLGLMAMGLLALSSCEKNDPVADNMAIGQRVPTVYWTVGSTACKAGEAFTFQGQYYTEDGHQPSHSEVWYAVLREDVIAAQEKLTGLGYNQQSTTTDTIRTDQVIEKYAHEKAVWEKHQFIINDVCPTSSTLSPVQWQWKEAEWTDLAQTRFNTYFPEGFDTEFCDEVKEQLLQEANEDYLRNMFINHKPFDQAYMAEINQKHGTNLPTEWVDGKEGKDKQAQWHRITAETAQKKRDEAAVAYYYFDDAGVKVDVALADTIQLDENDSRIAKVSVGDAERFCYAVYDASEWLYCRYDNDKGAIITTVIEDEKYKAAFTEMIESIPFHVWIKGSAAEGYVATFKRTHKLNSAFKVVDTEGNVGVCSTRYEITLN